MVDRGGGAIFGAIYKGDVIDEIEPDGSGCTVADMRKMIVVAMLWLGGATDAHASATMCGPDGTVQVNDADVESYSRAGWKVGDCPATNKVRMRGPLGQTVDVAEKDVGYYAQQGYRPLTSEQEYREDVAPADESRAAREESASRLVWWIAIGSGVIGALVLWFLVSQTKKLRRG